MSEARCHICGHGSPRIVEAYPCLMQVTSDCRPWRRGGTLAVCASCGTAQKVVNEAWRREAAEIYGSYALYPQGGGAEQSSFDPWSGMPAPRSRRLLERLLAETTLPATGRLLDIGCGNGNLFRSFHLLRPSWELEGTEFDDRDRSTVGALPGVGGFHTCPPWEVPGSFDLITLLHVLEHVPEPLEYLRRLVGRLAPGGRLVIECPDLAQNPFDIVIADHASHFTRDTLVALVRAAGYEVEFVESTWVTKELSIVARPPSRSRAAVPPGLETREVCLGAIEWLMELRSEATQAIQRVPFSATGIFGTSIAACWLQSETLCASYHVDEDVERIGRQFLGNRIVSPASVAHGSVILVPLDPHIARAVAARCERPGVTYVLPPEMDEPDRLAQHSAR